MINFLAILTISALIIMSIYHFYWAFGGTMGLDNVLPTENGVRLLSPSKSLTLVVALGLFIFSYITLLISFEQSSSIYVKYASYLISGIFILRAIGDFKLIGFFKKIKATRFAKYDSRYFSPLSLYIGCSILLLLSQ